MTKSDYQAEVEQLRSRAPIPTLWLFGKTGSGKSSIVRYLTGAESATIGEGFRPETKTSRRFDFPNASEPLLTFLDTRGLGEASYNPEDDIAQFNKSTQLIIVPVRVTDHALDAIVGPLRKIRKANPERPVLLVLTCLHQAPESLDIASGPDPFVTPGATSQNGQANETKVPAQLQALIDAKLKQFTGLVEKVIPIDLTQPADGFANPDFGGARLKSAILEYLPHAYRQALLVLNTQDRRLSERQKKSRWQVLASSALAGTAGAVPLPWLDIPMVLAVQTHMAMRIADIYQQEIKPGDWAMLSSATGSRIAMRLAITEALKFIPYWGMAVGAASSFAFTYAMGMSWDWYFASLRGGTVPSAAELKTIFNEQLQRGRQLWRAE